MIERVESALAGWEVAAKEFDVPAETVKTIRKALNECAAELRGSS